MTPSSFGSGFGGPEGPAPQGFETASGSSRRLLLIGGTAVGAIALGAIAYFTLFQGSGSSDAGQPVVTTAAHHPGPRTSPVTTAAPSSLPTVAVTDPAVNAHNPFAGPTSATTAGSATTTGGGSGATTAAGGSGATSTTAAAISTTDSGWTTTTGSTGGHVVYVTVTVGGATRTVHSDTVYLTLYKWVSGTSADFIVNGTHFDGVGVGQVFGLPSYFRFDALQTTSSENCAQVSYGSESHTLCPGDQVRVR